MAMRKRLFSIILTVTLVVGNMSGLKIKAAENTCMEIEETTITVDASEEEETDVWYIPEGVTRIEDNKFDGYGTRWNRDTAYKKIVLPSTLEYIGNMAFASSCIEEIVIPGNVKEIGNDAFWACDNLKKVTIEEGVEKIGRAIFRDCDNLETVILPKSIKEWNTECAFYNCNIKNITLPSEGLTTLGSGMFGGCPLEELVIPDCVTTMNYGVFICCEELKTVEAGYNVVNFVQGEEYYDLYSFTLGAFGVGCEQMVLKAPSDSAIVEYARYYRYFKVKCDYPDFEKLEYVCDGKVINNPKWETTYSEILRSRGSGKYVVYLDFDIYPETSSSYVGIKRLTENTLDKTFYPKSPIDEYEFVYRTFKPDGRNDYDIQDKIAIIMDGEREDGYYDYSVFPTMEYFKVNCYSQDENYEYVVVDEKYFRVIVTAKSFEEKMIQMEVLKSGTWDSEDAEWELITPAIDTSSLTPTPTMAPMETPTPTVEATVIPTAEPTVKLPAITQLPVITQRPTKEPTVIQQATPTPKIKTAKPGKTCLKSVKQVTKKKNGKKFYKKEVKLTWKKVKNADGYVIYMKTGSRKYKAVKTITKEKTTSYIKRKLKKGKTYYFKVRAYKKVGGEKLYGSYSAVKKVKVK